jgi:Flp pilus assembly protein TadD
MFQANVRMALADLLEKQGDKAGARDALGEALELYRAKEIVPSIERAERRLAALA